MHIADATVLPTPDALKPKQLANLRDVTRTVLTMTTVLTADDRERVGRTVALMPGQVVKRDERFTAAATRIPHITPINGSFEDAVRVAAAMSKLAPLSNSWYRGYQPVAVIQAADGAFGVTALLEAPGDSNLIARSEDLAKNRVFQLWSREHAALQAIVGANDWIDMRATGIGQYAAKRSPLPPS